MRPVFFMYNFEGMRQMIDSGTLYMPLSPTTILQQLSEDDYGAMVAEAFEQPKHYLSREVELASTEMTLSEVAETFSRVMGKKVTYQQIPFETFQQQAGEEVTTMFRWFEKVGYNADINALKQEFKQLSSLETYLRSHAWTPSTLVGPGEGQSLSVVGDTYRIIISGEQTGGAYTVIDMLVPPGGGPGPHAHAGFQEAFYVMEGEIGITTRAQTFTLGEGSFFNIPLGGMVHQFKNRTKAMTHMLCIITPAGMEKMFEEIGQPVKQGVILPPPALGPEQLRKFQEIAVKYGQQLFPPDYFDK
jgi:quercetin dioxygenase-like cupin family protein